MIRFFNPSEEVVDWLAAYAASRIVFDVGCGDGHLVLELQKRRVRALGLDPRYRYEQLPIGLVSCVLPFEGQHAKVIRETPDALILFCRPCHSEFVRATIGVAHPTSEVLYIGKTCNIKTDLDHLMVRAMKAPPCSEEKVYQVRR